MNEPIDWPEDVARIRDILATRRGVTLTDNQAQDAWMSYSADHLAGWIDLPADDGEIVKMITPHLPPPLSTTEILTRAAVALGHQRINPESLTDLKTSVDDWGWRGTAAKAGVTGPELRAAYNDFMNGLRAMFAPLDDDDN
jgi:hypothetical protein